MTGARLRGSLTALALVVASGAARADGDRPTRAAPPGPGLTPRPAMMLGDAFSALLVVGGGALTWHNRDCACEDFSFELVGLGAATYVAWGAFVHHDAGHDGRAVLSVGLRAGLPIAAGLVAHEEGASTARSVLAASGGAALAMALDWALAGRPRRPPPVVAYSAPARGGALAGLAGAF